MGDHDRPTMSSEHASTKSVHAHWDCHGGASGLSMLAASLHALDDTAVDVVRSLERGLSAANLIFSLEIKRIQKSDMVGTQVFIHFQTEEQQNQQQEQDPNMCFTWDHIHQMISLARQSRHIPVAVLDATNEIFSNLVSAEATLRGISSTSNDDITFPRESMVHVVGTLMALHRCHVTTVSCSALPLGEGAVLTEHGAWLPVPSPVTLQLLLGMPVCMRPNKINVELVTPTAAALLRHMTKTHCADQPFHIRPTTAFIPQHIGVGMSTENDSFLMTRLVLGQVRSDTNLLDPQSVPTDSERSTATCIDTRRWNMDTLTHLEANLDDMTAEALAFAVELLFRHGAVDAWVAPIVMKKGRAAHTLHCLCRSDDGSSSPTVTNLLEVIFRQTTTLGIRVHRHVDRVALRRSFLSVQTPYLDSTRQGIVDVKVGYIGDEAVSLKAEFDQCRSISLETGVALKRIADCAVQGAERQLHLADEQSQNESRLLLHHTKDE